MADLLEQADHEFNGIYRARVLDNNDPQKLGRIKAQVYPAFEAISDPAKIPWAVPAFGLAQGSGANIGSFAVPVVGTYVFVFFEAGDVYQPVYFAEAPTASFGLPVDARINNTAAEKATVREPAVPVALGTPWPELYDSAAPTYPNNKVIRTTAGIVLEMDDTPGAVKLKVCHPSKSWIEMLNDGSLRIHTAGSEQIVIKQDKKEYVKGTLKLSVDGDLAVRVGGALYADVVGGIFITGVSVNATISGTVTVTITGSASVSSLSTITIAGAGGVYINP